MIYYAYQMKAKQLSTKQMFNPSSFEAKWQKKWESDKIFSPQLDGDSDKEPYYTLMMFPYPSAEGMHVGNMYAHTGADIHARFKRMQGYSVFEPIGLDGFGIHSENYAMKVGRHPKVQAEISEANFYKQMHATGSSFDWQRTVETYDPDYYKWTQWLFTEMFKAGLAYKEKASVNFCPSCKTVLADEQVIAGECERCGSIVEKKELEQWFFRITQYAGRLLDNLPEIDWTEKVKIAQTNWIGRSKGALIRFPITDFRLKNGEKPNFVLLHGFKGGPDKHYLPWLSKQLTQLGYSVQSPSLPDTENPSEKSQVEYVLEHVTIDQNTIIVGHSLGTIIALKVLEKIEHTIAGLVLVGGFTNPKFIDGTDRVYTNNFTWEFDWKRINAAVMNKTVLYDRTETVISYDQSRTLADQLEVSLNEVSAQKPHFRAHVEPEILKSLLPVIEVFTTRPDTIFGANFVVIAPEHPIVNRLIDLEFNDDAKQAGKVKTYVEAALLKSENERIAEGKDKTGAFTGLYALNPATEAPVPIWVADYVLGGYGTGAIMAVPAHDERDYDFAKKYDLPITDVIIPVRYDHTNPPRDGFPTVARNLVHGIIKHPTEDKLLMLEWKKFGWKTFVLGGVEEGEDPVEAVKREIHEETGYKNVKLVKKLGGKIYTEFHAAHKQENRQAYAQAYYFELENEDRDSVSEKEIAKHEPMWISRIDVPKVIRAAEIDLIWERLETDRFVYVGDGLLQNSGELNGYHSKNDSDKIFEFISRTGIGEQQEQYHLRDWLISRQRYWGPPIPMIYCEHCAQNGKSWFDTEEAQSLQRKVDQSLPGWYPVAMDGLPVVLPDIADFKPEGTGSSPLANHPEFYTVTCPSCGNQAKRETDVSDTFLDSAWYFLRYLATDLQDIPFPSAPLNTKDKSVDMQNRSKYLPVHIYIGGAEHSVLHLLYARFTTMVLHDLGYLDFEEPFTKFFAHGLLIKEGAKMSKSKGNVIVPDEYIEKYGADTLRSYLMFLGPFSQGGDFYDSGIEGMYRFLRRVWVLLTRRVTVGTENTAVTKMLHKTIAGVTHDIQDFGYNTALSKIMEFYNSLTKNKGEFDQITLEHSTIRSFIQLLAPFAPHMTEELWTKLGYSEGDSKSIHLSSWPQYDDQYLIADSVSIAIQVNGKRRGELTLTSTEINQKDVIEERAKAIVAKYLEGTIKKVIYVPGKIINFVVTQ